MDGILGLSDAAEIQQLRADTAWFRGVSPVALTMVVPLESGLFCLLLVYRGRADDEDAAGVVGVLGALVTSGVVGEGACERRRKEDILPVITRERKNMQCVPSKNDF